MLGEDNFYGKQIKHERGIGIWIGTILNKVVKMFLWWKYNKNPEVIYKKKASGWSKEHAKFSSSITTKVYRKR